MRHPIKDLDEVVHQPTRLGIMTVLSEAGRVRFGYLKDQLELTDGNLSRHLQILVEAGYVELDRTPSEGRRATWAKLTSLGRKALTKELVALSRLMDEAAHQTPVPKLSARLRPT